MITNNIKDRIKGYFFENPQTRLRVRQIERATKAPLPSVIRYSKELNEDGILKLSDISGAKLFSADFSSDVYKFEKKCYNLKKILNSGLIKFLKEEYSNPVVILFGSYSKAEDIETSDIDLYIETKKKENFDLSKFEKKLNRKIQIFNYSNINKIENKELSNNIINGIILNGFIEVY